MNYGIAFLSKEHENNVRRLTGSSRRSSELENDLSIKVSSPRTRDLENQLDIKLRLSFGTLVNDVGGDVDNDEDEQRDTCRVLEVFDSMVPQREKVGFLVCCQVGMARFCNARFKTITRGFIENEMLHVVISEMHIDLMALRSNRNEAVIARKFRSLEDVADLEAQEERGVLEIRVSLLKEDPLMSLFVARHIVESSEPSHDERRLRLIIGEVFQL